MIHQVKFRLADFQRSRFFVVRGAVLHQGTKAVLDFLVDTGSVFTLIPTSAFPTLRLASQYQTHLTVVTSGGPYNVGVVEQLAIGSASVADLTVVGVDLPPGLGVKALLGSNFLQHFTLTADYRQARLLLED